MITDPKFPIDFVFPYVNPRDKEWQKKYNYCNSKLDAPLNVRFRDFSFLKFIFRSIERYAPWISNVFLLVSADSQIPAGIRKDYPKLKIITHDKFIPSTYLPTFNSNTIEMFVPFIPGLSEHFIYSNDDIFFVNSTAWTDFFNLTGYPKLSYSFSKDKTPKGFRYSCKNTWQAVESLFPKSTRIDKKDYCWIKQYHGAASPRLLSDCKACYSALESKILDSLTQFRVCSRNLNQYLFGYYSMFLGHYQKIDSSYIGEYLSFDETPALYILSQLTTSKAKMLCINDTDKMTENAHSKIVQELNIKLPERSKFEA